MSAIFNAMIGIEVDTIPNYFQSISASGYRQVEVFAPAYYELALTMPPMYYDTFQPIQAELLQMEHGILPFNTTIPHEHCPPYSNLSNKVVNTTANAGSNSIVLEGFPTNTTNVVEAGYFIQFAGSSKVYQIKSNANSNGNGHVTVYLNTILVASHNAGVPVRFGNNVVFHLQLSKRPKWNTVPGNIKPLYSFSDQFIFREIISKQASVGQTNIFHENWS